MQPEMDTKTSRAKKSYIARFVDNGVIMEATKNEANRYESRRGNGPGGGGGASDKLELQKARRRRSRRCLVGSENDKKQAADGGGGGEERRTGGKCGVDLRLEVESAAARSGEGIGWGTNLALGRLEPASGPGALETPDGAAKDAVTACVCMCGGTWRHCARAWQRSTLEAAIRHALDGNCGLRIGIGINLGPCWRAGWHYRLSLYHTEADNICLAPTVQYSLETGVGWSTKHSNLSLGDGLAGFSVSGGGRSATRTNQTGPALSPAQETRGPCLGISSSQRRRLGIGSGRPRAK
ncbi:hypothetical protein MKX08_008630 [Trichoderma sp. CBMAI-0020]|nr:hypothetical protein MKX08_008630 [Trichoderma sp. CBMAI-0020]